MSWHSRYRTEIADIFTDSGLLKRRINVEQEWLSALREEKLFQKTDMGLKPSLKMFKRYEMETKHDIAALVKSMEHVLRKDHPEAARYVHFGLTSQDINDTALTLQLVDSHEYLIKTGDLVRLELARLTRENRDVICVARTHGQHAVPITMGWKFANFLHDWFHACVDLNQHRALFRGKFSGSVGTSAALESVGINSETIEARALSRMGLRPCMITTQTVSRIYLVSYMQTVINAACQMEKIAKEIRNLQRTEIGELYEEFIDKTQVGSSAMPQKRNPVTSENICGLARVVRAQIAPLMETIALEHERDLTNSSVERVEIPTIMVLTHYMMKRLISTLRTLKVDAKRCQQNLNMSQGRQMSENIMTHLIRDKNFTRTEAHEFLNRDQATPFVQQVKTYFDEQKTAELMNPWNYLGRCRKTVDRILDTFGKPPPSPS